MDYEGTLNLLAAAQQAGVKHIVLISTIGTDDLFSPFNLVFGLSLFKKLAEVEVQRSGVTYTIIRPGLCCYVPCCAWTQVPS